MNELEIASFLDRGLSNTERQRVEDHLFDCSECRDNVAETQALVEKLRRPKRFASFVGIGGLVAVAAVALFVVAPRFKPQNTDNPRVSRDAIESAVVAVYEPASNPTALPVRFAWAAVPGARIYRITLSSAEGTTIWSASLTDTTVILPDTVKLQNNVDYAWFVDAIMDDGSTRSTGLRPLVVASQRK